MPSASYRGSSWDTTAKEKGPKADSVSGKPCTTLIAAAVGDSAEVVEHEKSTVSAAGVCCSPPVITYVR
ncbi:Hypp1318 [Branchiostoma lanceolatum]|uniref:Hypp1318 protein n=1 Tax=Branchiostoma lanceolatum TaxID=7740 RepID=A0A8K0EK08_BRALA|nr:Hypp1318 [Branchiostoma lanceolatum]